MQAETHPGGPAIPVRRPRQVLSTSIPRHWVEDDPGTTHFFDALSSTFPFGESFFVRSVNFYRDRIEDPALRERIRGFAGQEGQHSRLHDEHVEMLLGEGYRLIAVRNRIFERILRWQNRRQPRFSLAVTAALEHLTALMARRVLSEPERMTGAMHPEMGRLWRWHALEEAEHKSVAYDVLTIVAPGLWRRNLAMALVTVELAFEVWLRMAYMLYVDGLLWRRGVWTKALRFVFGRGGLLRGVGADYRAWYRRDFHPDQLDDRALIARHAPGITAEMTA